MINKKIKNATKREFDGIQFRSDLELRAYKVLKVSGLKFNYEPEPITLIKGFKCLLPRFIKGKWETGHKVRDWTYTPDFEIYLPNKTIIVEMKGFGNDQLPLKRKMLLYTLENGGFFFDHEYWEIYKIKELEELIKTIQNDKN